MLIVSLLKSLISLDNSLEVYDDTSVITASISRDVSLLKSLISVLNVWNIKEDKSAILLTVSLLKSLISLDNSLDV